MTPELFRKLAALGLSTEQMAGVLEIFEADAEVRKAKVRDRVQKWRSKNKPETLRNVTERSVTAGDVTSELARDRDVRVEDNLKPKNSSEKEEKKEHSPAARSSRGIRIPDNFQPDIEAAVREGLPHQDAERQALSFCDYWRAKPGKEALKLDWPATWRTWFRRKIDERQNSSRAPPVAGRKRNYHDVARDRFEGRNNGSESIFSSDGNAEFLPPERGQSRLDDDDVRGGFAGPFISGRH